MQRTFGARVRAGLIGGGASVILAIAALAAPALAADQPTTTTAAVPEAIGPHTHQLHGTVKTGGSTTFTVTTARYGDVNVSFTGATPNGRGHGHGNSNGHARAQELTNLANLTAGQRVVVQGRTSADGKTFVARRVHLLPAADGAGNEGTNGGSNGSVVHLVGSVTAASVSSLTVQLADGTSHTVTLSADTRIRPQGKTTADLTNGTKVTVVSRNGTATAILLLPA